MTGYLPKDNFRWEEWSLEKIMSHPVQHDRGCFVEADLSVPEHLHDYFNEYPLAPENMVINNDMLSEYCRELQRKTHLTEDKVGKLMCTLLPKTKYVCHYANLQLYASLGIKVDKIHRVLAFDQSPWVKSYIEMNTQLRAKATSDFEKDLYKLMNNAVFGKTMENVRNRVDFKLVKTKDKAEKLIRKIQCVNEPIPYSVNLWGFNMAKKT